MNTKSLISFLSLLLLFIAPIVAEESCKTDTDSLGKEYPLMMDAMGMDEKYKQIKLNLPSLSMLDNDQIRNMMKSMGPNYYWPVKNGQSPNQGLLILAHGYGPDGDLDLFNSLLDFNADYEIILSMGMSMMTSRHIECSVKSFKNQGVETIFIVPISSTPFNTLVRQWKYIFNIEDNYSYADVNVLDSQLFKFIEPISDDQMAKEIILEYANEISNKQEEEVVLIIAHGPVSESDNIKELRIMDNIAQYISDNSEYSIVKSFTLQDDAGKSIRESNVLKIRDFIDESSKQGKRVLIVSNLMSGKGIQKSIEKDLNGLTYTFNSKGLLTHQKFRTWIEKSIMK
jgi:Trp operon repressor